MAIYLHKGDISPDIDWGNIIAIDTETTGLHIFRDRLCLVQLSAGNGDAHLVQYSYNAYDSPNLKKLLQNPDVTKLFHYARFDMTMLFKSLGVMCENVFCTKIASRLCRTNARAHGLKDLCHDLLNVTIEKEQQTSDWASENLTFEQQEYAASDVLHLHQLHAILMQLLAREQKHDIALSCFRFLTTRVVLDLSGFETEDLFAHK